MKIKKVFTILVMLLVMTICIQAIDMTYLYDYKWKAVFRCYDSGCDSYWRFCKTVCINADGYIYNKNSETIIGEWREDPEGWLYVEFNSNCGQLNGVIDFLDSPSVAMMGTGHSYLWGKQKFVNIFLVREEPRKSKKMNND